MWRRPLNSAILVAATHKRLKWTSDGTSTGVLACLINKWMVKISQKRLYNVRDPPRMRGGSSKNLKSIVTQRTKIVIKSKKNILKNYFPQTLPRENFFA